MGTKQEPLFLQLAALIVCGDWRGSANVCRNSIIVQAPVMLLLLILASPCLNVE